MELPTSLQWMLAYTYIKIFTHVYTNIMSTERWVFINDIFNTHFFCSLPFWFWDTFSKTKWKLKTRLCMTHHVCSDILTIVDPFVVVKNMCSLCEGINDSHLKSATHQTQTDTHHQLWLKYFQAGTIGD